MSARVALLRMQRDGLLRLPPPLTSMPRPPQAVTTAFRWRHRFMAQAGQLQGRLEGLVEADETYVLHSLKGQRQLARKARRRGGRARQRGLSKQQVPVLLATARGGATAGQALARVSQASLQAALEPLLASDAVLLSDGERTRAVRGGWGSSTRR